MRAHDTLVKCNNRVPWARYMQGAAAAERLAAARGEAADAEAELARVQAEGPANHRKRDPIDKVLLFCAVWSINTACTSLARSSCGGRVRCGLKCLWLDCTSRCRSLIVCVDIAFKDELQGSTGHHLQSSDALG